MSTPTEGHVLVVDDEAAIREVLRDILADDGYRVVAARTLEEALAELGAGGIRAILADCLGASVDEPDLAFLARLRRAAPGVPIILCTARPWAHALVPAEHDLVAVLPKPFDLDDLLEVVGRCCRVARQRRTSAPTDRAP